MEHQKLVNLELETLKDMFSDAAVRLKEALLEGASWDELQAYRRDVTELEIALYNKIRSYELNPAEFNNRITEQD
jgi:hypothetical protein